MIGTPETGEAKEGGTSETGKDNESDTPETGEVQVTTTHLRQVMR